MKVKCIATKLSEVDLLDWEKVPLNKVGATDVELNDIYINHLGKEYTVYGLSFWNGVPFYLICEDDSDSYPMPFFYRCFEVADSRMSKHWVLSPRDFLIDGHYESKIVPEIWAQNKHFYERLVEGCEPEVSEFAAIKDRLENEFP